MENMDEEKGNEVVEHENLPGKPKRSDIGRLRMKCKPDKVYKMIDSARQKSRTWALMEAKMTRIGFGGVLKISNWTSINPRFVKWVVDNFEVDKVPRIRLSNAKVLELGEDDVHRVYGLPKGPRRIDLFDCKDEDIRELRAELGITGTKKSMHIRELDILLESLSNPSAWSKAAIFYIAYCLLNPININELTFRYAHILRDENSITEYNWCRHMLENLREGITDKNKLNPLGDMHFVMINYIERMGPSCRLLSELYTTPSLADWGDNASKQMDEVSKWVGFAYAVKIGVTKHRKGTDPGIFLPFDPKTCHIDKVSKHIDLCKKHIDAYKECMVILKKSS